MIPTTNVLQVPGNAGHSSGTPGPATGKGFLDALLTSLPPEAQELSLQELIEWLREQGEGAAGLVLPQMAEEMTASGMQAVESDPAKMLNWIMSSRQNMADGVQVEFMNSAEIGDKAFNNALLQTVAGDEEAPMEADAMLRVPVRHPEFGQAVGERLIWMVRNENQEARIRLDPPSLGPLEISVSIKDDRAAVLIHANHAVTRELLDAEAPRLRVMLGEQGFAEVDVNIARDNSEQQHAENHAAGGAQGLIAGSNELGEEEAASVAPRVKVGLVDHYV